MARAINKLTDTACRAATKAGMLGDGGGLYLYIKPTGTKSWVLVWKVAARRHEMGLGAYPATSLAKARKLAATHREAIAEGRNPITERNREVEPSFGECADKFLAVMEAQWKNKKHRAQWRMTLGDAYCRHLRPMKVSAIDTEAVLKVLTPVWTKKPETAARIRGRIERVLDFAKVRGWRTGENPALWRGHLKNTLPVRQQLTRGHHAALPYVDVPIFMQKLRQHPALSARALEFLILTAARSGEVLDATWGEVDLDAAIWTIPASRMKAGREHRVPLSGAALEVVRSLYDTRVSGFVFPGQAAGRPLSNMAFAKLMERMKVEGATPHGFRSSFRDWVGDATHFPRDVAEQALAHRVGDATELAYRRRDALEKRRKLMEAWADFCTLPPANNVVPLHRIEA